MIKAPDKPKISWKAQRRIREIHAVRLAAADFYYALNPNVTAHLLNISPEDAAKARKHPSYLERIKELEQEDFSQLRKTMREDTERLRSAMSSLVPEAIEVMAKSLRSTDGQIALRAAQEVLDRDGTMPKVSRLQTTPAESDAMPDVEPKLLAEFQESKPN